MFDELKKYTYWLAMLYVLGATALFALSATTFGRDDTDEAHWFGQRSGVHLRTDYGTGCQYLQPTSGGLSPRVDGQGRHMGCRP